MKHTNGCILSGDVVPPDATLVFDIVLLDLWNKADLVATKTISTPQDCKRSVMRTDFVRYHFNGTLLDGTVFESRWIQSVFVETKFSHNYSFVYCKIHSGVCLFVSTLQGLRRDPVQLTAFVFCTVLCRAGILSVLCLTLSLYEPHAATSGSRHRIHWWARGGWSRAWMRAFWACVWERSEILSSHPLKPTEKRGQVGENFFSVVVLSVHMTKTNKVLLLLLFITILHGNNYIYIFSGREKCHVAWLFSIQ